MPNPQLVKGQLIPFDPVTREITGRDVRFLYNPNKVTTEHNPAYRFGTAITGNQAFAQFGAMSPQTISFNLFLRTGDHISSDTSDITGLMQDLNYLATPLRPNQSPPMCYLHMGQLIPAIVTNGESSDIDVVLGVVSRLSLNVTQMSTNLYPTQATASIKFTISRRRI